ncbi:pur operon repressor [Shouchella lonarensis]|uniref:Purine operon repressor, PurR n=1 Tax=Shouchella lonarensis TaxID=1464122 RepID=A0A1G6P060_9BACI|nr:pur operon repressor [Shouchella lonarensis]SDC72984.1 purine operon repressor, PurR [Shouchella lonarensis]
MKKLKRSERLVHMTYDLLQHPHEVRSLTQFANRYGAAKSSISEDLVMMKDMLEADGRGTLQTMAGASGGVKFLPKMSISEANTLIDKLVATLHDPDRILPGGYLYMMDLLGHPRLMHEVGRLFAALLAHTQVDAVMTVATKGIPLAYALGHQLNAPVCIVRRDHRLTEGATVSVNYASGSSNRVQTMTLARRSLTPGSKVFIVDDFMKAGGTIRGMMDLLAEFHAEVIGTGVLVETADVKEKLIDGYVSLTKLARVDVKDRHIQVEAGNILMKMREHTDEKDSYK